MFVVSVCGLACCFCCFWLQCALDFRLVLVGCFVRLIIMFVYCDLNECLLRCFGVVWIWFFIGLGCFGLISFSYGACNSVVILDVVCIVVLVCLIFIVFLVCLFVYCVLVVIWFYGGIDWFYCNLLCLFKFCFGVG